MDSIGDHLERIWRAVTNNANAISQHANILDKNSEAIQRLIEQRQHDQKLDDMLKVVAMVHSNARAYNNLLIIAGYAAFFAMWGFLRDDISQNASHSALLMMLVSATAFVMWEVLKMVWLAWQVKRNADAMLQENPLVHIEQAAAGEVREAIVFGRLWIYVILVTVSTGVAAVGVLTWNLIELVIWPSVP